MKDLAARKASIRETLAQDSIAEAIKALKQWLPVGTPRYEDVLLIEARQNETNRKRLRDVLSDQELQLAYNRIRADLLDLVDSLEAADFDTSQPVSQISESGKVRRGHILHRIPRRMQQLQETRCVVRIALDEETIIRNIDLDEHVQLESVRVSDLMQVALLDPAEEETFVIRTLSTAEQFIDADEYTEWQFFVKPLREGTFPLLLKVAVIELVYGKERKREIVLEQAIDIVAGQPEEPAAAEFQTAGFSLQLSADKGATYLDHMENPPQAEEPRVSRRVTHHDPPAVPPAAPRPAPTVSSPSPSAPSLGPFRGGTARRAVLSLVLLIAFIGGAWAIAPAEVEWITTRYLFDTEAAYERYIERYADSRHLEQAYWRKAEIVDEPEAYLEYLENFPEAELAITKGTPLPQLEAKVYPAVSTTSDSSRLQIYLHAFPNSERRPAIEAKLDSIKRLPLGVNPPAAGDNIGKAIDADELPVDIGAPDIPKVTPKLPEEATKLPQPIDEQLPEQLPQLLDKKERSKQEGNKQEGNLNLTNLPPIISEEDMDPDEVEFIRGVLSKPPPFDGNYGTVRGPQGHTYRTFPIAGLTWLADNLNVNVEDSWCYNEEETNCRRYGRLYTWEAAQQACRMLGAGWRLPTDKEWRALAELYSGHRGDDINDEDGAAYRALMEGGTSGFEAQFGGGRSGDGVYRPVGTFGYYWTSTAESPSEAWYYVFSFNTTTLSRFRYTKSAAYSCRCVR